MFIGKYIDRDEVDRLRQLPCALTMTEPSHSQAHSVDRIDNRLPYIEGNVRTLSPNVNGMLGFNSHRQMRMDDDELQQLLSCMRSHRELH